MLTKQAQVAIKAANSATEVLLNYFRKIEKVEQKGDNPLDILTEADVEAERVIIKLIQQHFPEHNILAEETGLITKQSAYTWIIDPLDGTGNFAQGLPYFGISIALFRKNTPVLAVTAAPIEGELFYAEKGKGAWLINPNGSKFRISVSTTKKLSQAFGIIEGGHNNAAVLRAFNLLVPKMKKIRLLGSTALNLAYVAAGRVDFFYIFAINTHDIASGILLVEEAGGKVTSSEPISLDIEKKVALTASNGKIHREVVQSIGAL